MSIDNVDRENEDRIGLVAETLSRVKRPRTKSSVNGAERSSEATREGSVNVKGDFLSLRDGESSRIVHVSYLQSMSIGNLLKLAEKLGVNSTQGLKKQELVFEIVRIEHGSNGKSIIGEGTLDVRPENYGFLRSSNTSYQWSSEDIYVSPSQIRRFNLKPGDTIRGKVRPPKSNDEKYFALVELERINDCVIDSDGDDCSQKTLFENMTPLFPDVQIRLETDIVGKSEKDFLEMRKKVREYDFFLCGAPMVADDEETIVAKDRLLYQSLVEAQRTGMVVDIVAPIGRGQRGLIVAPPKSGKTVMLKHLAQAISYNYQREKLEQLGKLREKFGKNLTEEEYYLLINGLLTRTELAPKVVAGGVPHLSHGARQTVLPLDPACFASRAGVRGSHWWPGTCVSQRPAEKQMQSLLDFYHFIELWCACSGC